MIEANSCKKLLGAFNVLLALFHGRAGLTFEWITDYTYYFYTIVLLQRSAEACIKEKKSFQKTQLVLAFCLLQPSCHVRLSLPKNMEKLIKEQD